MIEPRSCGVLDMPLSRSMTGLCEAPQTGPDQRRAIRHLLVFASACYIYGHAKKRDLRCLSP
jgi:hypothetical protein